MYNRNVLFYFMLTVFSLTKGLMLNSANAYYGYYYPGLLEYMTQVAYLQVGAMPCSEFVGDENKINGVLQTANSMLNSVSLMLGRQVISNKELRNGINGMRAYCNKHPDALMVNVIVNYVGNILNLSSKSSGATGAAPPNVQNKSANTGVTPKSNNSSKSPYSQKYSSVPNNNNSVNNENTNNSNTNNYKGYGIKRYD